MTLLALQDVSRRFQDGARVLTVLDCVCLELELGELVGVYGQRRSGKSTLLRLAAGLEQPDEGTIVFDGADVGSMSPSARARIRRRGGIALASGDSRALGGSEPVLEHVALPLTNDGLTLRESEGIARPALERLCVAGLAHEPVERLSLSDRLHVELARAIVREPRVVLVDEPAVLPGPDDARRLARLLRSFAVDSGIAVLIASEDLAALAGVRRLLTLGDGRLRSSDVRRRVIPFPVARTQRSAV